MPKNETARAYLENLRTVHREINAMLAHRQDILELACQVTAAPSNTPVQGGADASRVETGGIRLAEYSLEIDKRIDALVDLKREAMGKISQIPDNRLSLILVMRYINAWDWDMIWKQMSYGAAQVYRLHREALRELQIRMTS